MLADLHVWHLRKNSDGALPAGEAMADAFTLETCQRWIRVAHGGATTDSGAGEHFQGAEAYAFLLRMSCGLESQMVGETEVLGQVKEAWSAFSARRTPQAQRLAPLFQKIFADAKTVRRTHLQNLGQASYGSLIRRLLTQAPLKRPVLVLGAGAFARSLLPWLSSFEVRLTNRTPQRAEELAAALQKEGAPFQKNPITLVPWDEALYSEIQGHCHILSCVPQDDALFSRIAHWAEGAAPGTLFFDLGEPGLWPQDEAQPASVTAVTLTDLYALQKKEENLRTLEVQRARLAIEGMAAHRDASLHITLSHGWEDLWSYGA